MTVSDSSRLDALVERLGSAIKERNRLAFNIANQQAQASIIDTLHGEAENEVARARKALEMFLASDGDPTRFDPTRLEIRNITDVRDGGGELTLS
jgi:hypothetical protein